MFIYNIVFTINFLLAFINILNKKSSKTLLKISFVILNLFLCLKYMNGIDWTNYQLIYLKIPNFFEVLRDNNFGMGLDQRNRSEIFFYLSMSIFKLLKINYEIYQYIVLTYIMYIMYSTFEKYSKYSLIGIFLYFNCFMLTNFFEPILRQLISIGIFYISINDIEKRKKIRYVLKILTAYLFHSSALMLLIFYFIPRKKIKKNLLLLLFFFILMLDKYLENILICIGKLIPILSKYVFYFQVEKYGATDAINTGFFLKISLAIILGLFIERNRKYLSITNEKRFYIILNLYWINEIFFILKRQVTIFLRVQMYFEIFYAIILMFLIEILVKKYGKKISILLFLIYTIFSYRTMFLSINVWKGTDDTKFFPYTNYLTEIIFNKNMKRDYKKIEYRLEQRKNNEG